MTLVRDLLILGEKKLSISESPFLDAVLLLALVLKQEKEKLLASLREPVSLKKVQEFQVLLEKRSKGQPIAYFYKKKQFFGRDFYVDERVLVPRPETELLVEKALEAIDKIKKNLPAGQACQVVDVGTGAGTLALTLALEAPAARITAIEIAAAAREVFEINRQKLAAPKSRVRLLAGDLLNQTDQRFHVIAANLPYVPTGQYLRRLQSLGREPRGALDGGPDGLAVLRPLIRQSANKLKKKGYLMLEASGEQMKKIEQELVDNDFSEIKIYSDLSGRQRVISGIYDRKV